MTVTPDRRDDDTAQTKHFELSEGDQEKLDIVIEGVAVI